MLQTRKLRQAQSGDTSDKSFLRFPYALVAVVFIASVSLPGIVVAQPITKTPKLQVKEMTRIRMVIQGAQITATLVDNATAKEFMSLLPITLTLKDYNKTEKVSDLPVRLSTEGAREGFDPSIGDITYYAPWGNLAVFYRDFGYSRGLVQLGRIESGIEVLEQPGPLSVTIEGIE